jgi:hypothetical protein
MYNSCIIYVNYSSYCISHCINCAVNVLLTWLKLDTKPLSVGVEHLRVCNHKLNIFSKFLDWFSEHLNFEKIRVAHWLTSLSWSHFRFVYLMNDIMVGYALFILTCPFCYCTVSIVGFINSRRYGCFNVSFEQWSFIIIFIVILANWCCSKMLQY